MRPPIPPGFEGFFTRDGKVALLPSKQSRRTVLLGWFAELFEPGREFSEKEVNAILNEHSLLEDAATLRRSLFELGLLGRTKDGTRYWRVSARRESGPAEG